MLGNAHCYVIPVLFLPAPAYQPLTGKIAARFGVNPGTVQRISRPFDGVAASAAAA